MTDQQQLEHIKNFLGQHNLAVMATVTHDGLPEAAVVGYAPTQDFQLIIGTFATSRKYINLIKNPRSALVIGWDQGITVQYEGSAEEVSGPELEEYKRTFLAKMPSAAKYVSQAEERFFKIKPLWIKYSDWSHDPVEEFEIKF